VVRERPTTFRVTFVRGLRARDVPIFLRRVEPSSISTETNVVADLILLTLSSRVRLLISAVVAHL